MAFLLRVSHILLLLANRSTTLETLLRPYRRDHVSYLCWLPDVTIIGGAVRYPFVTTLSIRFHFANI